MREDLTWLLGEEWYTEKIESGFETQKKHIIKAFWWFKGDLISQWIPKFYLCDESNPINPQCGKIFANFYISPQHPPHPQFYPQNGGNLDTLPGWPKKLHLNRPARYAGQTSWPPHSFILSATIPTCWFRYISLECIHKWLHKWLGPESRECSVPFSQWH